jgi:hypothetical protein
LRARSFAPALARPPRIAEPPKQYLAATAALSVAAATPDKLQKKDENRLLFQ